ncbi:MAG: PKD domain-containing protein [Thermoplasmata archaeon]|nr:PKD domain-containing protein [Thermoplasmata archaeon]
MASVVRGRRMLSSRARTRFAVLLLAGITGAGILMIPLASAAPSPQDFSVALTADQPNGTAPLLVQFHTTVTVGSPNWYAWSFGDQSYLNGSGAAFANPSHTYLLAGVFHAVVAVAEGPVVHSATLGIAVVPGPLELALSVTPTTGVVPVNVQFSGYPSGGTGTYRAVQWTFGDGGSSTSLVVQHTYVVAGHFRATLNVTDSSGIVASDSVWVNLTLPATVSTSTSNNLGSKVVGLLPLALAASGASGLVALSIAVRPGLRPRPRRVEAPYGAETEYAAFPSTFVANPVSVDLPSAPMAAAAATPQTTVLREPTTPPASESRPIRSFVFEPATPGSPLTAVVPHDPSRTVTVVDHNGAGNGDEPRQLSSRLVVYLAGLGALRADDIPSVAWTQLGMSERLSARQNVISNVLRRLVAAGVVEEELRHVQRQPRRLKVYHLTVRGEALARDLRRSGNGSSDLTRFRGL